MSNRSRPPKPVRQIERDAEQLARLVLAGQPEARDHAKHVIEQLEAKRQHRHER